MPKRIRKQPKHTPKIIWRSSTEHLEPCGCGLVPRFLYVVEQVSYSVFGDACDSCDVQFLYEGPEDGLHNYALDIWKTHQRAEKRELDKSTEPGSK